MASLALSKKSANMISITGRIPVTAIPRAAPTKPFSEIGVSITRSGPNSSSRPSVVLNDPPAAAISSPSKITRLSARSSSASAARIACRWVISSAVLPCVASSRSLCVDIAVNLLSLGPRSGGGSLCCRIDQVLHFLAHGILFSNTHDVLGDQSFAQAFDGVSALPRFKLTRLAVFSRVGSRMAAVAVGFAFEKCRPFSGSRPFNCGTCRVVDSIDIVAIDGHAWYSVGGRSYCQVIKGRRCANWAVLAVEIIFTDKYYRSFPHDCHVQRFVKCSDIGRTITEEGECNARSATQFGRHRRA